MERPVVSGPDAPPIGTGMTGLTVPKSLQGITPSWLIGALHSRDASGSATVTGYSAETIAEGKGFLNQVFRLRLHYDDDPPDLPRTIIVKLPSTDPALRMVSDRLGQDRREVRFYQEVAASSPLQTPHSYQSIRGGQPEPAALIRRTPALQGAD